MARSQVEQMLKDELDKITRELERTTSDLHERISALEQRGDGQMSGDGSTSSQTRQDACEELIRTTPGDAGRQLQKAKPKCRNCVNAHFLSSGIMQYRNDGSPPRVDPMPMVYCEAMMRDMPLQLAPATVCTMHKPDSSDSAA